MSKSSFTIKWILLGSVFAVLSGCGLLMPPTPPVDPAALAGFDVSRQLKKVNKNDTDGMYVRVHKQYSTGTIKFGANESYSFGKWLFDPEPDLAEHDGLLYFDMKNKSIHTVYEPVGREYVVGKISPAYFCGSSTQRFRNYGVCAKRTFVDSFHAYEGELGLGKGTYRFTDTNLIGHALVEAGVMAYVKKEVPKFEERFRQEEAQRKEREKALAERRRLEKKKRPTAKKSQPRRRDVSEPSRESFVDRYSRNLTVEKAEPIELFCMNAYKDGCQYLNTVMPWSRWISAMGHDGLRYEVVDIKPAGMRSSAAFVYIAPK